MLTARPCDALYSFAGPGSSVRARRLFPRSARVRRFASKTLGEDHSRGCQDQAEAPGQDPRALLLKITGDWQKFTGEPGTEGTLRTAEPRADKKERFAAAAKESQASKEAKEAKEGAKESPAGQSRTRSAKPARSKPPAEAAAVDAASQAPADATATADKAATTADAQATTADAVADEPGSGA